MHTYARTRVAALATLGLMVLLVAAPASQARDGDHQQGNRGINAVLDKLEAIETRIVADSQRLDDLALRLGGLERNVQTIATVQEDQLPCTPGRFRAGKCNPLTLTATACANLSTEASVAGAYTVQSGLVAEFGVGWDEVLDANLKASAGVPIVLMAGSIPIGVLPTSLELGAQGSGGVGLEICMQGLELAAPQSDAFAENLVANLEGGAQGMRASLQGLLTDTDVANPTRVQNALAGLRNLRDDGVAVTDPLAFFQGGGPLRNLADALPVGTRVTALLDNPDRLMPEGVDVLSLCDNLDSRPHFALMAGQICDAMADVPQMELVTRAFERIDVIADIVDNMQNTLNRVEGALDLVPTPVIPPRPPVSRCPAYLLPRLCARL